MVRAHVLLWVDIIISSSSSAHTAGHMMDDRLLYMDTCDWYREDTRTKLALEDGLKLTAESIVERAGENPTLSLNWLIKCI